MRVVSLSPPAPPQVTKLAGRAKRVGEKRSSAEVSLGGTFTAGAAIDLRATTVGVSGLLDEIDGAGELVSGRPLQLSPRRCKGERAYVAQVMREGVAGRSPPALAWRGGEASPDSGGR